jgi:hypothetical protein
VGYDPKKVEKLWVTLLISRTGAGVFFFPEKGAMSIFFFEKGAVGQKRLGTCGLDNRLTDGGKVVSPTHRPRFSPQKHFSVSGTHFC